MILRAFGLAERIKVTSTYTFGDAGPTYGDVRAGDDITICHVASRNYSQASDFGTAAVYPCDTRDPSTLDYASAASTATVHFVAFTDVAASLVDLDTASAVHDAGRERRRTSAPTSARSSCSPTANIIETELAGDLLAGHIHSTAGDVTMFSPARILDADCQPTIDVTGRNITMTAGTAGGVGGIGLPTRLPRDRTSTAAAATRPARRVRHGRGRRADARHLPRRARRRPARRPRPHRGRRRTATGNVSLRTVAGSIVDGADDLAADVRRPVDRPRRQRRQHRQRRPTTSRSTRCAARRSPARRRTAPTRTRPLGSGPCR